MDSTQLHFNLVVLAGMIAVPPDADERGAAEMGRFLLAVRSAHPSPRLDLIPVSSGAGAFPDECSAGDRVWVAGSLQRRFSSATGRSRIEVAAQHIDRRPLEGLIGGGP